MKRAIVAVCLLAAVTAAQWIEGEVFFPDSLGGLSGPRQVLYNPGNNNILVGGSSDALLVLDGVTNRRIARIELENHVHNMLYVPSSNLVYVSTGGQVEIIDPAALRRVGVIPVERGANRLCYNRTLNKLYCLYGNYVTSIDVAAESVMCAIDVLHSMDDFCCNPVGNKLYCGEGAALEGVLIIDCTADTIIDSIWTGEYSFQMLYNEAADRVYVTEDEDEDVAIIDATADTLIGYIYCWGPPYAISQSDDGAKVYVSDPWDNRVLVIDPFGDSIMARVDVGDSINPDGFLYNGADRTLYCNDRDRFCVIDGDGDSVLTRFTAVSPAGMAHNPLYNRLYLTGDDQVMVLDCATNQLTDSVLTWFWLYRLAYSPQSRKLYCASRSAEYGLLVLDAVSQRTLSLLRLSRLPGAMLHEPVNDKLYLLYQGTQDTSVVMVDCATDSIVAVHTAGSYMRTSAVTSSAGKVYAVRTDSARDEVVVFDAASDTVVARISVPHESQALGYNPICNRVYVSHSAQDVITVIDAATDTVMVAIDVPPGPGVFEWVASRNLMCCICYHIDAVIGIDSANRVSDTIMIGFRPYSLLYNPTADKLYCASSTYDDITVIDCSIMAPLGTIPLRDGLTMLLDATANRIHARASLRPDSIYVIDCDRDSLIPGRGLKLPEGTGYGLYVAEDRRFFYTQRNRGSLVMVRDSTITGVWEPPTIRKLNDEKRLPTIVRDVLFLPGRSSPGLPPSSLHDIMGRRVVDLMPGENDIRHLSPGVYFLRRPDKKRTTKVVVQR